jgi:hypothetical protein
MTLTLPCVSYIKGALLEIILRNQEHNIFKSLDQNLDKELETLGSKISYDLRFPNKNSENWINNFKPNNKNFTYYYRLLVNLASTMSTPHVSNTPEDIWVDLINCEFTKVNCLIALVAWLTTDDWRWHKEYPHYNIPEDLSYGLVLQEPQAVINFALYILGYNRTLDHDIISEVKTNLKDYLKN